MTAVVYYINNGKAHAEVFSGTKELSQALEASARLRKDPANQFVSMQCQPDNMVGNLGVTEIIDGKTPDGHEYSWKKRRP